MMKRRLDICNEGLPTEQSIYISPTSPEICTRSWSRSPTTAPTMASSDSWSADGCSHPVIQVGTRVQSIAITPGARRGYVLRNQSYSSLDATQHVGRAPGRRV